MAVETGVVPNTERFNGWPLSFLSELGNRLKDYERATYTERTLYLIQSRLQDLIVKYRTEALLVSPQVNRVWLDDDLLWTTDKPAVWFDYNANSYLRISDGDKTPIIVFIKGAT